MIGVVWCLDRFTPEARQVMRAAHLECDRLGHRYFGNEHLLLGLLANPDSVAGPVLRRYGLSLPGARAEITQIVADMSRPGGAGALRQWGIDAAQLRRQMEAEFGPVAVADAACRAVRSPWWSPRRRPDVLWRQPFLAKPALEAAAGRAASQKVPVSPLHLLFGLLADVRRPVGSRLHRRHRARLLAQLGLPAGAPAPARLLLDAYGIDRDAMADEVDRLSSRRQSGA